MTRKHYVEFAKAIAALTNKAERRSMYDTIAPILKADNSLFDYSRFKEACKLEG